MKITSSYNIKIKSQEIEEKLEEIIINIQNVIEKHRYSEWGECHNIVKEFVSCFLKEGITIKEMEKDVSIYLITFYSQIKGIKREHGGHVAIEMFGEIYDPILSNYYSEIKIPMESFSYVSTLRGMGIKLDYEINREVIGFYR